MNTSKFLWNSKTRTFTAEISSLREEKIDEIRLQSATTGRIVTYKLKFTKRDEGDIIYWELEPIPESVVNIPECKDTKIIIFND